MLFNFMLILRVILKMSLNVKQALEEMKFFCKHIDILGVYKMSNFRKK